MLISEDEAKTKWCPKASLSGELGNRDADGQPHGWCIASGCMFWRERMDKIFGVTEIEYERIAALQAEGWKISSKHGEGSFATLTLIRPTGLGYCGTAGTPE